MESKFTGFLFGYFSISFWRSIFSLASIKMLSIFFSSCFLGGSSVQYSAFIIPSLCISSNSICSRLLSAQNIKPTGGSSPSVLSYLSSHFNYSSICPLCPASNLANFNSMATSRFKFTMIKQQV